MAAFVVSVAAAADVSLLACAYMTGQVQVHKHHMWLVAPDCTVGCKPLPAVLVKTQGMILKQSGQPASQPASIWHSQLWTASATTHMHAF